MRKFQELHLITACYREQGAMGHVVLRMPLLIKTGRDTLCPLWKGTNDNIVSVNTVTKLLITHYFRMYLNKPCNICVCGVIFFTGMWIGFL